jgi:imidazolonepropionase-like amidohydrolase
LSEAEYGLLVIYPRLSIGGTDMRTDIVNGTIITGDGKTLLENSSVIIKDCYIEETPRVNFIPYNAYADKVIDAQGGFIIPGVINMHAHAVAFGTYQPWGLEGLSKERLLLNLDTHLRQGTTTILNTDGLCLPAEIEAINKIHPVNVKMATSHYAESVHASEVTLGHPVEQKRKTFTAAEAVALGAVALGEIGSPGTSYGTYEKSLRLGKVISARFALALDKAVIEDNKPAINQLLKEGGLAGFTVNDAKKLVKETSIDPVAACCEAIRASAKYVKALGIPVLAHAEPGMREALLDLAKEIGPQLIVVHVNHSFTPKESVELAKELKRLEATVEIITADFFRAKQVESSPEGTFALIREGLVDLISTDFSGGNHEPILLVLQKAVEQGIITIPKAIQLATSAPVKMIPKIAPNRGLIEPGRVADICIVDKDDISKVKHILIAGRTVIENGRIVV